jgi:hypothetical protein
MRNLLVLFRRRLWIGRRATICCFSPLLEVDALRKTVKQSGRDLNPARASLQFRLNPQEEPFQDALTPHREMQDKQCLQNKDEDRDLERHIEKP